MDPAQPNTESSDSESLARSRIGTKPQVGGGIAVFLGILLFVFTPPARAGMPDIHRMVIIFIAFGVFLITVGTSPDGITRAKTFTSTRSASPRPYKEQN